MSDTSATVANAGPSIADLEVTLAQRRQHLSGTIDELVTRVTPREILRRQVEGARISLAAATRTPDGELRTERVAGVLGAASVVLLGAGLIRRQLG